MSAEVLDRDGNQIQIGSTVRCWPGVEEGTVHALDVLGDGEVCVSWPSQRYGLLFRSRRRFTARRSYRCRDLVLSTQPNPRERKGP